MRLQCVLIRIPPQQAAALRELSKSTRVPASEYYREAVADLVKKYGASPPPAAELTQGGAPC